MTAEKIAPMQVGSGKDMRTFYDKLWDAHIVASRADGSALIYIDRHLVHEVTSPQAFEALRREGRTVRRPDLTLAVPDHNVPTTPRVNTDGRVLPIKDKQSAVQLATLQKNVGQFNIPYFDANAPQQGIVHVIGPEQGFSLPGTTIVCGDSHTSAHGAMGALAFGIGTSEVEQVLATQTLILSKSKNMLIKASGELAEGVSPKDLILHIIGKIGTGGATGHVIEYSGEAFASLSIEGRLTVANMSIEAGARAGLFAPDDVTFAYLKGRPLSPKGEAWEEAVQYWRSLKSDSDAHFDKIVHIDVSKVEPTVSWGTSPEDVAPISGVIPTPESYADPAKRDAVRGALDYMDLSPGQRVDDIMISHIFIGSCTNSRIEDLRAAARVLKGRNKAHNVEWAIAVPGSGLVKRQAEAEGLHKIFLDAGFEWREPGCSACLAMNPDKIPSGKRCASTSNRNFVGRQGPGSRTHLLSPAMAAAAAITGKITDVRALMKGEAP